MSDLIDRDETIKQFCKQDCDCDPKDCPDKTGYEVEIIESVPTRPTPSNTVGALDCVERQAAIDAMERINRVFNDLGLSCAYDMPGFWCHDGKDYKVIPTKYHKGYQQALSDAEKRIKRILTELCYG